MKSYRIGLALLLGQLAWVLTLGVTTAFDLESRSLGVAQVVCPPKSTNSGLDCVPGEVMHHVLGLPWPPITVLSVGIGVLIAVGTYIALGRGGRGRDEDLV